MTLVVAPVTTIQPICLRHQRCRHRYCRRHGHWSLYFDDTVPRYQLRSWSGCSPPCHRHHCCQCPTSHRCHRPALPRQAAALPPKTGTRSSHCCPDRPCPTPRHHHDHRSPYPMPPCPGNSSGVRLMGRCATGTTNSLPLPDESPLSPFWAAEPVTLLPALALIVAPPPTPPVPPSWPSPPPSPPYCQHHRSPSHRLSRHRWSPQHYTAATGATDARYRSYRQGAARAAIATGHRPAHPRQSRNRRAADTTVGTIAAGTTVAAVTAQTDVAPPLVEPPVPPAPPAPPTPPLIPLAPPSPQPHRRWSDNRRRPGGLGESCSHRGCRDHRPFHRRRWHRRHRHRRRLTCRW